jgi:Zn-dependent peptidase ImmA (M78 family)
MMRGGCVMLRFEEVLDETLPMLRAAGLLTLPVDPVAVARLEGINVYSVDLENGLSGLINKDPGEDPEIFLNANHAPVRQRFTCAHELGHYFDMVFNNGPDEYYFERAHLAQCGTDRQERFANGFAAGLLMPEQEVREFVRMGVKTPEMALRFHVSVLAMENRLKNLTLLAYA